MEQTLENSWPHRKTILGASRFQPYCKECHKLIGSWARDDAKELRVLAWLAKYRIEKEQRRRVL